MGSNSNYTTIRVSRETHEAIESQGRKNEDFDEILRRILGEAGITVKEQKADTTQKLW